VLPGLYLGNFIDAKDPDQLGRNKITHIISIHESPQPLLQDITYLRIPVADTPEVPIKKHFKECINFIHCCRLNGGNCLVHCCVAKAKEWFLPEATRPIANPNPGFRQQLEEFGWGSSRKGTRRRTPHTAGAHHPLRTSATPVRNLRPSPQAVLVPVELRAHLQDGHQEPEYQIRLCFGEEYPGPPDQPEERLIMAHVSHLQRRITPSSRLQTTLHVKCRWGGAPGGRLCRLKR
uniref:Dual specificity phosphatase 15 n=1 Tax=Panthera tigris altaica TaxID=74533 RepID=A0A8C9JWY1_PANTA